MVSSENRDNSTKLSPNSLLKKFKSKKTTAQHETESDSKLDLNNLDKSDEKDVTNSISQISSHSDYSHLDYELSNREFSDFESFFDEVKRISESSKIENLDFMSTPQLSDALQRVTGSNGVIPALKSVNGRKTFGRIFTGETHELDWGTSVKVIDEAQPGQVIFLKVDGDKNAVWGELTSTTAQTKGISGIVIYGACRDLDALKNMEFPIFSINIVPNAGKPLLEGNIGNSFCIEGITINPGDYVLGDECGVVIIPQNAFKDTIRALWDIKNSEKDIISQINEGKSLLEILKLNSFNDKSKDI